MEVQEYLDKMKEIQDSFLEYIDDELIDQDKFNNLINLIKDLKIQDDKYLLKTFLYFLSSIIDYHFRTISFFEKIFKVILILKDHIKKHFTNIEIFDFFQNPRILLFLSQEKILNFDKTIASKIIKSEYQITDTGIYLFPEIKQFLDSDIIKKMKIPTNLEKCREIEYYDHPILQLIQKDLIDEFISQTSKIDFKLDEEIEISSVFETNPLLQDYNHKPIDYAAFFGSIKIFKYLVSNKCELEPYLWFKAIHGRNPEIIHILEDAKIEPENFSYQNLLAFAIQCHHDDIAQYILNNYIENNEDISLFIFKKGLRYFDFSFIESKFVNKSNFYEICRRNYYILSAALLRNDKSIDINMLNVHEKVDYYSHEKIKIENTVLFSVIEKRNIEIIHLLLQQDEIDVNKKSLRSDDQGQKEFTPLQLAIANSDTEIVQILLNHKNIKVNMKSNNYDYIVTPLYTAIRQEYKNIDIIKLLIKREDVDINLQSIEHGREFINEGERMVTREITPLYQAVKRSMKIDVVKLLLERKDININAITKIKQEKLNRMANDKIYHKEETALYCAIAEGNTEYALLLLDQENIDINFKSKVILDNDVINEIPLLQEAINIPQPKVVKKLLENKKIDVNIKISEPEIKPNPDCWSEENIKSCKLEIQNKLRESECIGSGLYYFVKEKTIFYFAIEKNNQEIVQYLLGNENIDVNTKSFYRLYDYFINKSGREEESKALEEITPLYLAVENGNYEIIKLLVENERVDLNQKSSIYSWKYKKLGNKIKQAKEEEEEAEKRSEEEEEKRSEEEEEKRSEEEEVEKRSEEEEENRREEEEEEVENRSEEEEEEKEGEEVVDKEETALHEAVAKGNVQIVKLLLGNKNIDVNIIDKQGRKPADLSTKEEIITLINHSS